MKRQRIAVKVHIHLDGVFARGRSCHTWSERGRLRERGLLRLLYLKVRSHKADHSDSLTLTEVKRCHRRTHTRTHTFEDSHWRQRDESTKQPQKLSHVTRRNSTDLQISLSVCFTAPCNSLSGDCKDTEIIYTNGRQIQVFHIKLK